MLNQKQLTVDRQWCAMFSQTGSEIVSLANEVGRMPDCIITNQRPEHLRQIIPSLKHHKNLITVSNKPTVEELDAIFSKYPDLTITLHGWLRIMPAELCDKYTIYNGHPGLITQYPELKGKDPQKRAIEGNYPRIGCVLHKVTAELDNGPIIDSLHIDDIDAYPKQRRYAILKQLSFALWARFLHTALEAVKSIKDSSLEFKDNRIVLIGSSSVGKTTLLNGLKDYMKSVGESCNYEFLTETTRTVKEHGFEINEHGTDETQLAIASQHLLHLIKTGKNSKTHTVFDRCFLDLLVYSKVLGVSKNTMSYLESIWKVVKCEYTHYIYLPILFPTVDDGVRTVDEGWREVVDATFKKYLTSENIKYLSVTGDTEARIKQVLEYINN